MNIIRLVNVSKSYKGKKVLSDVDLDIDAGDFLLICGDSGAGKTTLLNIISGMEDPNSGSVIVGGIDLNSIKKKDRDQIYRSYFGLIHQNFYLDPKINVYENISLAGYIGDMPKDEIKQRVFDLAKKLKIEDVLSSKISEVSGGQVERICVARALFMNPKVIIADEPTNNLDQTNKINLLDILTELRRELGITVIMVSHDNTVDRYATKKITIANGMVE
ncbi:ABC transporter ATP-binding protein [Candidatus Saccharibacteria bacterium]|nr:ABC transporter ATP-binding protein [Candidatus Saccharibacteria bacterium]